MLEGGPRRDKGFDVHLRPEARLQVESEGLGKQGDVEFFRSGAQKRRGNSKVAQSPEFDDEQFGFQWRGLFQVPLTTRSLYR